MQARKVDYNCRLRWHDTCYECDWRKARTLKDTRRFMCQGWKAECLLMSQKYPLGTRGNNFLKFPNALWDAIIGEFKPRSCGMWDPYCTLTPSTKASCERAHSLFQCWQWHRHICVYHEVNRYIVGVSSYTLKAFKFLHIFGFTTAFQGANLRFIDDGVFL